MADLSITAANVVAGAGATVLHGGKAGATITAGQIVYLDASDRKYKLADADSETAAIRLPSAVALNGASDGQPLSVLTEGPVTIGAPLTPGTAYYLSATPGGIAPVGDLTTGDYPTVIGIATSASVLDIGIKASGVAL
ncbi:MAG: hypothetical protein CMN73_04335 [Sphingomonas sp.]|nr:hypothetical protein [Sphingomonas sp.]|tara:strand:+ start:571 stop:984 length:414 start_codon:yes stop_codon:yes gene_type:complete